MTIEKIYSTPIYYSICENKNDIQKELEDCILEKIEFKMKDGWGKTHYLSDISFSENFIQKYQLKKLETEIIFHVKKYLKDINFLKDIDFQISSSWASLFQRDNYGHIHNHGYADISGVYYFKTNNFDGDLFFQSPNPYLDTSLIYEHLSVPWEHKPIEGKLLLFPGWLRHGIKTNQTDNTRISISFNIIFDRHHV